MVLLLVCIAFIYRENSNKPKSNYLCSLLLLWFHVWCNKELSEKEEKTQNVHKIGSSVSETISWALITVCQQVKCLRHHGNELDKLHRGQWWFPPNVQWLSSLRNLSVHADEVVGVHDSVDESIQYNCEVNISIILWVSVEPIKQKDGEMMVYV